MKNPNWQRDELILALNLYFKYENKLNSLRSDNTDIIELSKVLNNLPIHKNKFRYSGFRNPNGVRMKLYNFSRMSPCHTSKGLKNGNKLETQIWLEFASDRNYLQQVCNLILRNHNLELAEESLDDDEDVFPEGKIVYKIHRSYERNKNLVFKAKEVAIKKNRLICSVCGFNFQERYGDLGKGYIECHHLLPISQYDGIKNLKIKDLALVCSNCHKMLHRKRPWLTINKLKEIIAREKSN